MKIAEPRLREILRAAGWPEHQLDRALEIMHRESRWNPRAFNENDPFGGSYGLFQLNGWWNRYGHQELGEPLDRQMAMRPLYNARYAYMIWRQFGWKPWSTA